MNALDKLEPVRSLAHPPLRALEACAFEPDGPDDAGAPGAHVRACATCAETVERLRRERDAFLRSRPSSAFVAEVEARAASRAGLLAVVRATAAKAWHVLVAGGGSPRLAMATGLSVVVLALGVLVYVAMPDRPPLGRADSASAVSLKGADDLALAVHVSRGGGPAAPLDPARPPRAGDVLRFVARFPADGYAFVANLDERGIFTLYWPVEAPEAARVEAGTARILSGSVVLDEFVGRELIVLVWGRRPFGEDAVREAVLDGFARAGRRLERLLVAPPAPEGTRADALLVLKEGP